jgi:ubiquinol-cytochrome c reductase cytochrome c subunit
MTSDGSEPAELVEPARPPLALRLSPAARRARGPAEPVPGAPVRRGRLRRRVSSVGRLLAALVIVGGLYTALAPGVGRAEETPTLSKAGVEGKALYEQSCISCHGGNGQGIENRGPSLIGVGSAAVEFQVSSGRMPAARPAEAQAERKPPIYTDEQARKIGQYIQDLGGGPQLPEGEDLRGEEDASIARGGELFRVNCSSCHAFSAGGGALSSGKFAPTLAPATDRQIYAAMLTGPQNMPVFGDNQLTPDEKRDVIAYVQNLKSDQDPGGWGISHYGPVPEALVIFLIGMVFLVFVTLWIAGKS